MTTLFQRLLGKSFDELPEPVRRFHTLDREVFTSGRSTIAAPRTLGGRLLAKIAGLPAPGENVGTFVRFSSLPNGREYWRRDFAGRRYQSVMEASRDGRLIEHFGPFDLFFELTADPRGLRWSLSAWSLLKIPLPKFTTPTIECVEAAEGDRFTFDIDVTFPIVGHVVHYAGGLTEDSAAAPIWVYDGVCLLCDWSTRYALAHEITPSIRFIAIQSREGRELARANGVDPENPETFLFVENGRVLKKSDAMFALARQLREPARLAFLARLLPRFVNDFLYDRIARNRYQWFGRKETCVVPDVAMRHRFVLPNAAGDNGGVR